MKSTLHNASRRSALKTVAAGAAALAMPMIWTPSRAASKRIVVRDDGGIYSKAYTRAHEVCGFGAPVSDVDVGKNSLQLHIWKQSRMCFEFWEPPGEELKWGVIGEIAAVGWETQTG